MSADRDALHYRLKAASRELIALAGGVEAAAGLAGLSASQVGRFHAPGEGDLMSLRCVARLEAATGQPVVSRALVEQLGWRCGPTGAGGPAPEVSRATAIAVAEAADVMREFSGGMREGRPSPAAIERLSRELTELAAACEAARRGAAAALAAEAGR